MNIQDYGTPLFEWVLTYWMHSTVLFFAVFLLLKIPFFKQNNIKDTLWKIALIGGLVTTTFQVNLGIQTIHLATYFQFPSTEEAIEMPLETVIPTIERIEGAPIVSENSILEESESRTTSIVLPDAETAEIVSRAENPLTWEFILIVGWLGVSLFLIGRYLFFHFFFFKKLGKRNLLKDTKILNIVEQILSITNIHKQPKITYSTQLNTPIVIGNSEICLPKKAISQLTTAQQQSLIAHEVAHIVRKDYYWLLVARLLETIFFFQPLNRIIRKEMQITAEHLCDSWASRTTGNALALAACLVEIASWITQKPKSVLVSGMALRKSELSNRIYQLINQSSMKMKNLKPREYLFLTLMLTTFMVFSVPRISLALEHNILETVLEAETPVWDFQQQPMKIIPKDTVPKPNPKTVPNPTPNPIPNPAPIEMPEMPELPDMDMEKMELQELVKAQELALKAQKEAMLELKKEMEMQQLELAQIQEEMKRELKATELEMKREYEEALKEKGANHIREKEGHEDTDAARRAQKRAKEQMERQMKMAKQQMERQQAMTKAQMERQQAQMKRQMELQQRQMKMEMERVKEQVERQHEQVKRQVERAKAQAERQQAIAEAEMKEHNKRIDAFKADTANELVKDGIIAEASDFKSLYVKKGMVKVNGKKLTDKQSKKYISMIDKHFGASHRSHFQFNQ